MSRRTVVPGAASQERADKRFCRSSLLAVFGAVGLLAFAMACSGSRELTRSRAGDLIKESSDFSRPVSVALLGEREQPVRANSTDESVGEAMERAFDEYARSHTEIAVFRHLGLIDFRATLIEGPTPEHQWWRFGVEPALTEKGGREVVEEEDGKGRKGIVISRRELVAVTGVTTPAGGEARADFTWKEVPTTAGEAFDPTTETYSGLPEWLRRSIAGPSPGMGRGLERKYGVARKGTALLRLYNDGWRVLHIQY